MPPAALRSPAELAEANPYNAARRRQVSAAGLRRSRSAAAIAHPAVPAPLK